MNPANDVEEVRDQPQEEYARRPFVEESGTRSMSLDSREDVPQEQKIYEHKMPSPPKSPTGYHHHGSGSGYASSSRRYAPIYRRLPSRHIHSVVSTSFSIDEERDDHHRGYSRAHIPGQSREHHDGHERDAWGEPSPREDEYFVPTTPSPKKNMDRSFLHRSYSSSGYFGHSEAMKRSYYHHSLPTHHQQHPAQLPPEFMPPTKRTRLEPSRKEIIVSPREDSHSGPDYGHVVHRAQTFPTPPSWVATHYYPGSPHAASPHSASPIRYMGSYHGSSFDKHVQVSPASEMDDTPRSWGGDPTWNPSPYHRHSSSHFWESPRNGNVESSMPSPRNHSVHSTGVTEYAPASATLPLDRKPPPMTSKGDEKMRMMVEAAAAAANSALHESTPVELASPSNLPLGMLLALPDDRVSLSETLCVVRENIEVFTATQRDVDAPAPGRKHAVVVGQVGLRCIHCRHTMKCSDRVKRAVCYPSSIKRIYRTVIDMKLDHFSKCKFVPTTLKNHLSELKAIHTRSTGTTMQYFIQAAHMLGMKDGPSGVVLGESTAPKPTPSRPAIAEPSTTTTIGKASSAIVTRCDSLSSVSWTSGTMEAGPSQQRVEGMASWSFEGQGNNGSAHSAPVLDQTFEGLVPLALAEDKTALSPLRCFLREQVCAFSATEKDIAVRAPTTFSIAVGQVGIGCIHCIKQSARHRSNRAVCFPFSIGRIYQSVADIQRFHFGECKAMPIEIKDKFHELQSASSKGSKGLATRQYWVTSAKKIGLVDTPTGIRFGRDPSKPESSGAFSLDILAQVAFSVTTASKPLVTPEDKPCIAEFLYVVMEQLQPCRFTEADRNKRRLKDVGCIGVECKHCAGQVDSRKFFWSSVSAVESNFVSVHTHVLECKSVPECLKARLIELKNLRKEQTAALRTGSQKSFFARVWQRLHESDSGDDSMPSAQFRELSSHSQTASPSNQFRELGSSTSPSASPSAEQRELNSSTSPSSSPSAQFRALTVTNSQTGSETNPRDVPVSQGVVSI
jgi:hypothetical protein